MGIGGWPIKHLRIQVCKEKGTELPQQFQAGLIFGFQPETIQAGDACACKS
jgi:hypothetical protein